MRKRTEGPACEGCRWWKRVGVNWMHAEVGECRRNPPADRWSYWPVTLASGFCGEFESKAENAEGGCYRFAESKAEAEAEEESAQANTEAQAE